MNKLLIRKAAHFCRTDGELSNAKSHMKAMMMMMVVWWSIEVENVKLLH